MDDAARTELIRMGWKIHGAVEEHCLRNPAASTDDNPDAWREKQRLLLAHMAIHLLQTAIRPGEIELDQLRNNLHAILTISDRFLPQAGLKAATEQLYPPAGTP